MTKKNLSDEVQRSLDDLRHIRRLVDESQKNRLFINISRSIGGYFRLMGWVTLIVGVGLQLIMSYAPETIAGLSRAAVLWIIGGLALLFLVVLKNLAVARAGRRYGFTLGRVFDEIFQSDYLRLVPAALLVALGAVLLGRAGETHYLLGFISAGAAVMMIAFTSIVRLRWMLILGLSAFILSLPATFLFPEYPFYKIAVCWGVPLIACQLFPGRDTEDEETK